MAIAGSDPPSQPPGPAPESRAKRALGIVQDITDDYLAATFEWVSRATATISYDNAKQNEGTENWLWYVLRRMSESVTSLAFQTGNALAGYWSKVLQPIWYYLAGTLAEHERLAGYVWSVALRGVDYLTNVVLRAVLTFLSAQLGPIVQLVQTLRGARVAAWNAGSVLDLVEYGLGLKAWAGLGKVREWANLSAAWSSFMFHEKSVLREDPFVWSLCQFVGDFQYILVESFKLPPDELAKETERLAKLWPGKTLAEWLTSFATGAAGDPPELAQELDRFRKGE